ncbi:MAG: hypothetical protein JWO69_2044 [Thermoleophilia bacterium]|nr:hypothetical protein [Thermoleophilia bacterium]
MNRHARLILLLSIVVINLRAARQQRALIVAAHRDAHALDAYELQMRAGR